MTERRRLTFATGVLLHAIARGHRYGFDLMDATGLPDGTVYPALRRMEREGWLVSRWEDEREAHRAARPARKYFELTPDGHAALEEAVDRFPALGALPSDPRTT